MTPKEAHDVLKNTPVTIHVHKDWDSTCKYFDALDMAIDALERAEKYKWHKCEKISDLPAANLIIQVREEDAIGNVRYAYNIVCILADGTKAWAITGDYPAWKITHWRYIEPVEDEE